VDVQAQKSVLLDELILKRQATIRAPFSLHMRRSTAWGTRLPSGTSLGSAEPPTGSPVPDVVLGRRAEARPHGRRGLVSPLVAVPIEPRRLEAFAPSTDATMRAALRYPRIRLPVNPVSLFSKTHVW
jgi:hypothetical protein